MSRRSVVYVVQGFHAKAKTWLPVIDREGKPIEFRGTGVKPQATTFAQTLTRYQTYEALKVIRQQGKRSEVVCEWDRKQGGVSV